ncbi:hypothetical protein J1605_021674 [Eschrichtius robustus]|uniref:Low molecular weight phosphotyrosine protein phosphatase n=1 Tax=Eschrichtius robustus TaxID=9764 RepID=A0AB34HDZ9_ESCRO|nr:hypothetical protein J1605_021674 [Eschrichtius robustus]
MRSGSDPGTGGGGLGVPGGARADPAQPLIAGLTFGRAAQTAQARDCTLAPGGARAGLRGRAEPAPRGAHAPRRKSSDVISGRLYEHGKMAEQVTKSVLFVCLGNICRSPIAEAVFRKLVTDQNISDTWRIDSAATSTYELGNPPDYRGQACMKKHGIPMSHVARQWVIDSGAVSDWNVGRSPDPRAVSCLRDHGINTAHKARQELGRCSEENTCGRKLHLQHLQPVTKEDFATFDYMLCMDESNLRDLNGKSNQVRNCRAKIELLGSYDPQKQFIIEDPYYGNDADFEAVYQQCVRCCRAFLEKVR